MTPDILMTRRSLAMEIVTGGALAFREAGGPGTRRLAGISLRQYAARLSAIAGSDDGYTPMPTLAEVLHGPARDALGAGLGPGDAPDDGWSDSDESIADDDDVLPVLPELRRLHLNEAQDGLALLLAQPPPGGAQARLARLEAIVHQLGAWTHTYRNGTRGPE